jgi:hypothetical protein
MRASSRWKPGLLAAAGAFLLASPGVAQTPSAALASLHAGMWQLRSIGGSAREPVRSICIRNPAQFLQLQHGNRRCTRRVLSDSPTQISVRYECPGAGWGHTTVRVETPRLAQVDTQGIDGNSPFHHAYEARRTGECS